VTYSTQVEWSLEDDDRGPDASPAPTLLDMGDLPVEELALIALREAQRPRQIYQAHKWFARRFGSAFRALLTASALPEGDNFWPAYYAGVDLRGRTVLDPFVGGGTSVIEAQRLGAHVVGVDVDAVACAVTDFETRAAEMPNVRPAVERLQREVGEGLRPYYTTEGQDGRPLTVLHYFWVQVVECGRCGVAVEAHPHHQLAYEAMKGAAGRQWAFCRLCHAVQDLPASRKHLCCSHCGGARTAIGVGTVSYGKLTCPHCGTGERLIDGARRTGKPPRFRLFALETLDPDVKGRRVPLSRRSFKAATRADRVRVEAAAEALAARRQPDGTLPFVPERAIPDIERADDRLTAYGYRRYRELFLPRQLLHLSLLGEAISGVAGPGREALALAYSDHLTTNCVMTGYAGGYRRVTPLFSLRAYRHIPRPVEVNPWLDGIGRGTYPNAVRQVQRAIEDARAPKEAVVDGGFVMTRPRPPSSPQAARRIIHANSEGTQAPLPLARGSVDFVLSDPPYFDNIAYPELSDFFFPWLQQFGLVHGDDQDRLAFEHCLATRRRDEAAAAAFGDALGRCFGEIARVLKPGGRMAFTYRHHAPGAWAALARAIATSDLSPIQLFPMLGEGPGSLHTHDGTALWDAVFVLARPSGQASHTTHNYARERQLALSGTDRLAAHAHADRWSGRLASSSRGLFREADRANFLRASLAAAALGLFARMGCGAHGHQTQSVHDATLVPLQLALTEAGMANGEPRGLRSMEAS